MRKLFLYVALLLLSQCSKCKDNDPAPEAQLPPATQTGANTFGCLVNGEAWTPVGFNGYANYVVNYDPSYRNGTLNIAAYRLSGNGGNQQDVGVYSDSLRSVGVYPLTTRGKHGAVFLNRQTDCRYYSTDVATYCRGTLTITRLDLQAGIVSGTFAFTLYKPGCDSIRVTQGRFDKKL